MEEKPPTKTAVAPAVIAARAGRKKARVEQGRLFKRHRKAVEERTKERDWPIYGPTHFGGYNPSEPERADLDPDDVQAPIAEIREVTAAIRAEADQAPSSFDSPVVELDETLFAHRKAERDRERAQLEKVVAPTWTEDVVEARIEEAFKTLFRSAGDRHGPRGFGTAMPTPVREMSDLVNQAGNKSLRKAMGRLLRNHGPPTADEVRRQDEALSWALLYLGDDERDLRMFVNLGGMWKAWGARITDKCREIGVHRQVFYRDRKTAIRRIVEGLIRDGKAPT